MAWVRFWVPPGTTSFRVRSQNNSGRSQREDHGITLFSPRGQRMAVLWGQANPLPRDQRPDDRNWRDAQVAEVLVEPGAAGRGPTQAATRFAPSHRRCRM